MIKRTAIGAKFEPTNVARAQDAWRSDSSTEISGCGEFNLRDLEFGSLAPHGLKDSDCYDWGKKGPPPAAKKICTCHADAAAMPAARSLSQRGKA